VVWTPEQVRGDTHRHASDNLSSCHASEDWHPVVKQPDEKKEVEEILKTHGADWQQQFPCLDGLSGRPSIKDCVRQALNHKARDKYKDVRVYLEGWLQNASRSWLYVYNREKNAPITDPALDKAAIARKAAEEEKRRKDYEARQYQSHKDHHEPQIDPELQALFDPILAERKPDFLMEMLRVCENYKRSKPRQPSYVVIYDHNGFRIRKPV
jgi:acyl transferase domain-containing protein